MTGTNDKLRSLFLTMLMVVSVFGGTVAFTGTAAAANTDPGVSEATEIQNGNGDISIEFNKSVWTKDENNDLNASHFTVYVREAGTNSYTEYNQSTRPEVDVQLTNAAVDHTAPNPKVTLEGNNLWGDLSPADEVKVNVGNGTGIATAGAPNTGVNLGNVTVELSAAQLTETGNDNNVRGDALRVYQGTPIRFQAIDDDTDILLENVETGEILLDGSTGANSQSIVFESDNLESGTTYRLTYDEGGADVRRFVNVTSLRLSASMTEDGTLFEHNEDVEFTVSGDAIRGNEDLAIEVRGPSDQFFQSSLDNRAEFEEDISISQTDIDAGDYTVAVIDVQTGVEVTAGEFSVDEFPTADSASFGGGVFEEERGDVTEIPIQLSDSTEGALATVSIGSLSETNYVTNVTVADEDGDGEVVLEWNTYMSGTNLSDRIFTAQGEDNVTTFGGENGSFISDLKSAAFQSYDSDDDGTVSAAEAPNSWDGAPFNSASDLPDQSIEYAEIATIDPASYDLAVVANDDDDNLQDFQYNLTGVDEEDVGAVSINSRSTESSDVWVVPSGKVGQVDLGFIDENTDNTEDAIDGNLTQSSQATNGELVVHQISASGLEGILRNRTDAGVNATSAFLAEDTDFGTSQFAAFNASFTEEDVGPNRDARAFNLDTSNTVVIPDYQNDTYYVAVKLGGVDEDKLVDGDTWNASFQFAEYDSIGPVLGGDGGGTVSSLWTYYDASATLNTNADDEVIIRNQAGQTIRGSTNVAPGTKLGLRINSQSDTSPFLTTLNTHVNEDRTFAATGDFSNRGAGINFTVRVRRGGDQIGGPYDGMILAEPTASATFSDQAVSETNQEVIVDSATLSDGGFIAIHEGSASGDVIGTSGYLEAGQHSNVRIDLDSAINGTTTLVAMPHLDDNSNNLYDFPEADAPYTADGSAVTASASVSLDVETPTPTPTATPSPTPTPTATPSPTPTPTATPSPTPTQADDGGDGDDGGSTPSPTTTDGGPGFGVAVSLIALLAAALLAARRRE